MSDDPNAREQLQVYWETVGDAIDALRAAEIRDTYAAISLEELVQRHTERLSASTDPSRLDALARVKRVQKRLTDRIAAMKEIPPSHFRRRIKDDEVLTPPGGDT